MNQTAARPDPTPSTRWLAALCLLLALESAALPAGNPQWLDELIELQTGSFSSALQSRQDARYEEVVWHIAEIWPDSARGKRWIYTEAWLPEAAAPYMQRIASYSIQADGSIVSIRHAIPDAQRFIGAWRQTERFAGLDPQALEALPGCETILARTGERRFEGGTIGHQCPNTHRGAAYMVSRTVLDAEGMLNWDRGFAGDGALRWGPAAGGYRFRRVDADQRCIEPVRLLVYGEVLDRQKFLPYARALADSGLYPRHGGRYEATTPALEVLEGSPPDGRGVIIAHFPCVDAARAFWDSPEYREIRRLREGIAEFEVLVLPASRFPAGPAE